MGLHMVYKFHFTGKNFKEVYGLIRCPANEEETPQNAETAEPSNPEVAIPSVLEEARPNDPNARHDAPRGLDIAITNNLVLKEWNDPDETETAKPSNLETVVPKVLDEAKPNDPSAPHGAPSGPEIAEQDRLVNEDNNIRLLPGMLHVCAKQQSPISTPIEVVSGWSEPGSLRTPGSVRESLHTSTLWATMLSTPPPFCCTTRASKALWWFFPRQPHFVRGSRNCVTHSTCDARSVYLTLPEAPSEFTVGCCMGLQHCACSRRPRITAC